MNLTHTDFSTKYVSSMSFTRMSIMNSEHIIKSDNEKLNGKKFFSQTETPRTSPFSHGLGETIYSLAGIEKEFKTPLEVMKFLNK